MNHGLAVIYVLAFIRLLITAHLHGQPIGKYSFPSALFSVASSLTLTWWALGWRFF